MHTLRELTAQWAEGSMRHHPNGYSDGPAAETVEIADDLAALNRAGLLTIGSQPGRWIHVDGANGADLIAPCHALAQRAALDAVGDPDLIGSLVVRARAAGLTVVSGWIPSTRPQWDRDVVVTVSTDDVVIDDPSSIDDPGSGQQWFGDTRFGGADADDVRDQFGGSPATEYVITSMHMITVIDPVWARRRYLWDTLHDIMGISR